MKSVPTYRTDGLYYDGPDELSRDSVIAVYEYLLPGTIRTMRGFDDECGVQHNTASKAINILVFQGHDIRKKYIGHPNGKHHYEYWLVAKDAKNTSTRKTELSRGISAASRVLSEIEYSQSEDHVIEVLEKYLGLRPGADSAALYPFECRERQKLTDYLHQLRNNKNGTTRSSNIPATVGF